MAMDVYAPCPCGSGKKLKFCCQNIADDMERISRLIENNQPRQALQQLEQLDRRAPGHAWVITTQAVVLLETGETLEARNRLKQFTEQHPEHEFGAVLYAAASFQNDGMDVARPTISRAFQKGAKKHPGMPSGMAASMAAVFRSRGNLLACREHLALALKFAPEAQRQDVFVRLLDFDNDATIPYPIRSAHPLPVVTGEGDIATEVKKALKYASVGCWNTAAASFTKLASEMGVGSPAWHAAGLCHAWFGDDVAAATALHSAAQQYTDPSPAVECETLAQILDWNTAGDRVNRLELAGETTFVSRLLTSLDAATRLQRLELPPQDPNSPPQPTAIYQVLDVDRSQLPGPSELTLETIPKSLAEVVIFDAAPPDQPVATVEVVGFEGRGHYEAVELVKAAAGELVSWKTAEPTGEFLPRHIAVLTENWAFPPRCPVALRRRLEETRWKQSVTELWPKTPQPALQGRTPQEATTVAELRVPLLASLFVLDAVCLRGGYELDRDGLARSIHCEPLPAVQLSPERGLNTLSPLEWLRLPLSELSDQQLTAVANRAQLVHHDRFLYETLKVILERPACLKELDVPRIYQTLADLCRVHNRREEGFTWFAEGRTKGGGGTNNFEEQWTWDLRELLMRLEDPTDPGLKTLTQKFVAYYTPKLPQMRPYIEKMFALAGVPSPWMDGSVITSDSLGMQSAGGVWTPGGEAEPAAAGSKLWLPT